MKTFGRIDRLAAGFGPRLFGLQIDQLLTSAQRRAQLDDFGEDDGWREALAALLNSACSEAHFSTTGWLMFREQVLRNLVNRLELVETWRRTPQILDQDVGPVYAIVALPRTGTTLLHNLLALDPGARAPEMWELLFPCPPPVQSERRDDPRIGKTRRIVAALNRITDHTMIHPMIADAPDECYYILASTFSCISYDVQAAMPSYRAWLLRQDRKWIYVWHRKVLQTLQWKSPGQHWVLKSPLHLFGLDAFLDVYPDARIIQTHREPNEVVGSCCSLYESARRMWCHTTRSEDIGKPWLELWGEGLSRAMSARNRLPEQQVFDVDYRALVANPMRVLAQLYAHFGLAMPGVMPERVRGWLELNPQHKCGVHRYSLEPYGVDSSELAARLDPYLRRFLASESAAYR